MLAHADPRIITASRRNGPLVLRHELGHSLIPVGEEYEGGFVYSGVNADKVEHIHNLKWKRFLSDPRNVRIEDAKVPLQAYPWHDLDDGPYAIEFEASNPSIAAEHALDEEEELSKRKYPTARLRTSLSSIPYVSHVRLTLNGEEVDLSSQFAPDWDGVLDRRWVHLPMPDGIPGGKVRVEVELTEEGKKAKAGQGGKMISSIEIAEYGRDFESKPGFVGAFPTYDDHGRATLRPVSSSALGGKGVAANSRPTKTASCAMSTSRTSASYAHMGCANRSRRRLRTSRSGSAKIRRSKGGEGCATT